MVSQTHIALPAIVKHMGASRTRVVASCGLALLSAAFAALMVYLVDTHVPDDPLMAGAYYPANKVILSLGASGICAAVAWTLAVPALLNRNATPLLWLVPLSAGWIWFIGWYDWHGLFEFGKLGCSREPLSSASDCYR